MIKHRPYRASATPPPDTPESAAAAPTTPSAAVPSTGQPKATNDAAKGTELGEQIGHKLKAMFDDVVSEPVPEKFRQLLEELERKSGES